MMVKWFMLLVLIASFTGQQADREFIGSWFYMHSVDAMTDEPSWGVVYADDDRRTDVTIKCGNDLPGGTKGLILILVFRGLPGDPFATVVVRFDDLEPTVENWDVSEGSVFAMQDDHATTFIDKMLSADRLRLRLSSPVINDEIDLQGFEKAWAILSAECPWAQ